MEDLLAGADGLFAARRYGLAAGCYRSALEDDPTCVAAHLGLAECFVAQGGVEPAVAGLVAAATGMRSVGLLESAGTLLARAVALVPDRLDLHVDVAELELACGRTIVARQRLESLARAYTQRGQHEEASAILEVVEEWSNNPFSEPVYTQVAPMQPQPMQPAPSEQPGPRPLAGDTLDAPVTQTLAAPVEPTAAPAVQAQPRPRRKPRPSAVLEVRPTPPPIAKPGTSAAKVAQAAKARPKKTSKPAKPNPTPSTPLPPGLDDIPPPATGRPISGAAADAKVRFSTMRKRAAARGFSRMVPKMRPKSDLRPSRKSAPHRPAMPSPGSSLAARLKLRSDVVVPGATDFEDEQTRVFDLRSAVDLWDHHTQIFDLD